jgi:GT2 family glycosyltransferase
MQPRKSLSIVIPCWNSEVQLKQNLSSVIAAAQAVSAQIIIVDDHSTLDNSVTYLKSLGDQIKLYQNDDNLGYGASVNYGVSKSTSDLVVLLNTDVRPAADCFTHIAQYFEDPSTYAITLNSGEDWMGGRWSHGLFHHFRTSSPTSKTRYIQSLWASGGQGVFDRRKWQEIGGMDLLYKPFYWEDTDMGYVAWKRGWQILYAKDCRLVHDHHKSVIASNFRSGYIKGVAQRNQFLFVWKNISDPDLLFSHLIRLPYFLLKYPVAVLSATLHLPQVLSTRRSIKKYWVRSDRDILKLWTA